MANAESRSALQQAVDELSKAAEKLNETAGRIGQSGLAQTVSGSAGAVAAAASTMNLTAQQRLICERVINAFETGSITGNYGAISIFADGPNDIRQITYGRAQTTEYGNLAELVRMYVEAGGTFSNDLRPYVDRIGRTALVEDSQFKDLLRRAGREDQVMRDTQDKFFDRRYFQPARRWAETNGFMRALSMLVIYDSFIHSGSILDFLRSRFPEPIPARNGNEQTWVRQYVDVRDNWLRNHHRPAVRNSAYRTRDLQREIARGNWALDMLPISANGVAVDARPIGTHVAGVAAGVPHFPKARPRAMAGTRLPKSIPTPRSAV